MITMMIKIDDSIELRLLKIKDAKRIFDLVDKNRRHLRKFLGWVDATKSVLNTKAFINRCLKQHLKGVGLHFGIWVNSELIGINGFHTINPINRHAEFGYWLSKKHCGKGIITKTCKTLIKYAFKNLKMNKVVIACSPKNTQSLAIAKKLGFKKEGLIRDAEWLNGRHIDNIYYGLLKKEWKKGKPRSA